MTVRMQAMANEWERMRGLRGPNGEQHVIHVEFGHFSSLEAFKVFEQYAVRNADSLGMNELEMKMLLDYWKGDLHDINRKSDSTPSLEDVLEQTNQLFTEAKRKGLQLSRVHTHPYGSFLICYD